MLGPTERKVGVGFNTGDIAIVEKVEMRGQDWAWSGSSDCKGGVAEGWQGEVEW